MMRKAALVVVGLAISVSFLAGCGKSASGESAAPTNQAQGSQSANGAGKTTGGSAANGNAGSKSVSQNVSSGQKAKAQESVNQLVNAVNELH